MSLKANKNDWLAMLSMMNAVDKDLTIKTDGKQAVCMATDPPHVIFVKCTMDCIGDVVSFTVNCEQFMKAIGASGGSEQTIEIDRDKGVIKIVGESNVRVPLIDESEGTVPDLFSKEEYNNADCYAKFKPIILEPLISYGLYKKQDSAIFSSDDSNILTIIIGEGQNQSDCQFTDAIGKPATIKCSLDYVSTIVKQAKGSNDANVGVELVKTHYPMIFKWKSADSVSINVLLAPWIDEE